MLEKSLGRYTHPSKSLTDETLDSTVLHLLVLRMFTMNLRSRIVACSRVRLYRRFSLACRGRWAYILVRVPINVLALYHLLGNRWKPASISAPFCKSLRRQRRTWSLRLAECWSRGTQPIWMSAIALRSPARIIVGSLTGRDYLSKRTTWLEFAATCSRYNASCANPQRRMVGCRL